MKNNNVNNHCGNWNQVKWNGDESHLQRLSLFKISVRCCCCCCKNYVGSKEMSFILNTKPFQFLSVEKVDLANSGFHWLSYKSAKSEFINFFNFFFSLHKFQATKKTWNTRNIRWKINHTYIKLYAHYDRYECVLVNHLIFFGHICLYWS